MLPKNYKLSSPSYEYLTQHFLKIDPAPSAHKPMDILTPPCHFCQSETQSTFCSNCAIQHHLIHVQTYKIFPIMDTNTSKQIKSVCSITCQLKSRKFQVFYMNDDAMNQPKYTSLYNYETNNTRTFVTTFKGYPLTPSNIMTKLPIYLLFS